MPRKYLYLSLIALSAILQLANTGRTSLPTFAAVQTFALAHKGVITSPPSPPDLTSPQLRLGCPDDNPPVASYEDLWNALHDYFGDKSQLHSAKDTRVIIATLPDPIHTQLGLQFDRMIDAIQLGAQASQKYSFVRAVLPWDPRPHQENVDFRIRSLEDSWNSCREKFPGLMIFQPSGNEENTDESLLVFLVGETPMSGIRNDQFQNALEISSKLELWLQAGSPTSLSKFTAVARWDDESVEILGPTFSGSFLSLHTALANIQGKNQCRVTVVRSGTASGDAAVKAFSQRFGANEPDFASFVQNDRYAIGKFVEFATRRLHYQPWQIAILSEDETQYGFGDASDAADDAEIKDEGQPMQLSFPREISQLRSAYQKDAILNESENNKDIPRAALRSDLEENHNNDDTVPTFSLNQTPLSQEAILQQIVADLRSHGAQVVVIRATDPVDQLFLTRYIHKSYPQARIVVVSADLLFARDQLADPGLDGILALSTYPLFGGGEDFVATPANIANPRVHAGFGSETTLGTFNAMLSLARTPVCVNTVDRNLPDGNYFEYGPSWFRNDRNLPLAPQTHLMVLGRTEFWPLAVFGNIVPHSWWFGDPRMTERPPVSTLLPNSGGAHPFGDSNLRLPLAWKALCLVILIGVFVHLWLVVRGSVLASSETFARFAPIHDWRRAWVLSTACVVLLAFLILLFGPIIVLFATAFRKCGAHVRADAYLLALALIALTGAVVLTGWKDLRRRVARNERHIWVIPVMASVLLSIVTYVTWNLAWPTTDIRLTAYYRYVNIISGVSPVAPLLLLLGGAYWCLWQCLNAASLLDKRRPRLPDLDTPLSQVAKEPTAPRIGESASSEPQDADASRIARLTENRNQRLIKMAQPLSYDSAATIGFFVALATVGTVLTVHHPFQGLEGTPYEWCFGTLLVLLLTLLCTSLLKLVGMWVELRRLLAGIDRLPLRRGLSRLAGFDWKPIWRSGGNTVQTTYGVFARELESLQHVSRVLQNLPDSDRLRNQFERDPDTFVKDAQDRLSQIIREAGGRHESLFRLSKSENRKRAPAESSDPPGAAPTPNALSNTSDKLLTTFGDLQSKIAVVCGVLLKHLERSCWSREDQLVADCAAEEPAASCEEEKSRPPCAAVQVVEEFVSLVLANFIVTMLCRMRTLIVASSGMFVMIVLAVSSYPFGLRHALQSLLTGLFLCGFALVFWVYSQMHHDHTLSRLTNTETGSFGFEMWLKLSGFAAVPVITLLTTYFPSFSHFLWSWLLPIFSSARGG
ncbi:MAG TPA: hypothetical protein VFO34_10255 [Candidatus Acidoferrales bacterium]|nr:hypothetical protein [Candidatus Acidoferrales bacterium]